MLVETDTHLPDDPDKIKQLLEAMKKDVDAATAEDFLQTPEVKIDFELSAAWQTECE